MVEFSVLHKLPTFSTLADQPHSGPHSHIINKKICLDRENSLQSDERVCGGQNSLWSNPENVIAESKKHTLYSSANMGKWGCNDCNQKGDRFDMQGVCRGK